LEGYARRSSFIALHAKKAVVGEASRFIFLRVEEAKRGRFGLHNIESDNGIGIPQPQSPLGGRMPDTDRDSKLAKFRAWLRENGSFGPRRACSSLRWSVLRPGGIWSGNRRVFRWSDFTFTLPREVIQLEPDPIRTKWFPGVNRSIRDHLLRFGQSELEYQTTGRQRLLR